MRAIAVNWIVEQPPSVRHLEVLLKCGICQECQPPHIAQRDQEIRPNPIKVREKHVRSHRMPADSMDRRAVPRLARALVLPTQDVDVMAALNEAGADETRDVAEARRYVG